MRAFAATQFTLTRFGAWRTAVVLLGGLAVLTVGIWVVAQPPGWRVEVLLPAGCGVVLLAWLAVAHVRMSPLSLRWDAQRWHLGPADSAGHEPWVGDVQVAIDLGAWMLLRFKPDVAGKGRAVTWVPVQRRGLEAQWHTLRCALYSPHPGAGKDAAPDV